MTGQSSMQLQKYDGASYRKKAFSHMKEARLHLDGRLKGEVVLLFHCKQQEGLLTRTKEMVSNEKKRPLQHPYSFSSAFVFTHVYMKSKSNGRKCCCSFFR